MSRHMGTLGDEVGSGRLLSEHTPATSGALGMSERGGEKLRCKHAGDDNVIDECVNNEVPAEAS